MDASYVSFEKHTLHKQLPLSLQQRTPYLALSKYLVSHSCILYNCSIKCDVIRASQLLTLSDLRVTLPPHRAHDLRPHCEHWLPRPSANCVLWQIWHTAPNSPATDACAATELALAAVVCTISSCSFSTDALYVL